MMMHDSETIPERGKAVPAGSGQGPFPFLKPAITVDTRPCDEAPLPPARGDGWLSPLREILDRPFLALIGWDGEKLAWVVLLAITVLSRVIGLGDRAMSHDESLHTLYSWKLYDGQGYQHSPMMHGPLKFVLNAGVYFLFGVNDWSSRIQVALFGILMVWLVWLMRPWLGKVGAFLAAGMYAISPALLYHSRYIRDEVMLTALTVLLAIGLFRYMETRGTKWLVWTAVVLGLALTTMEASFILGGIFGIYLVLALAGQLWLMAWSAAGQRGPYRVAVGVALPALLVGMLLLVFRQTVPGMVLVGMGGVAAVAAGVLAVLGWRERLRVFPELDLIVLLFTLVMPFLSAIVLKVLGWEISQYNTPNALVPGMIAQGGLVLAVMFVLSGVIGWYWLRGRWFAAAGLFWAIELLLFTTFLTNGQGIGTGLIGSLGYWIDQQEVMRGGQPWYYFWLVVPLYEFLPVVLAMGGGMAWLLGKGAGAQRGGGAEGGASESGPIMGVQQHFVTFLVFWVLGTWAVFTYVGEKMPWHVVYFTMPMALLGGWWLGRVVEGIDWAGVRVRGGWWLLGMVPLGLVVLKALLPVAGRRPFADVTVSGLSSTAQWLLALVLGLVLVYLAYGRIAALGWEQSRRLVVMALSGLLAVWTVSVGYRFAFVNYDYATEPMVYAHATPDIKLAMGQIEEISRKTVGDRALKVAYDDDATWPLEWYLRDYARRAYYGANPSRDALDAPVVIAGDRNLTKVRPYLGDRYYEFDYRLIWWPRETYKDLSWQRIWDGIRDPVQRGQFWNMVIHRRYAVPTAEWEPPYVHRFSMFVRKDVAAEVWDWGVPAGSVLAAVEDPYVQGQREVAAEQQIGVVGVPGTVPGQFNFPRALAVGADGRIYVADSGNHRVQVFDAEGQYERQWGSMCKLYDGAQGCQGDGRGQFNEPWGIAVGGDGSVYVSDTWNHRLQKFDSEGNFVTMWGVFETTGGELGQPGAMYGPRGIVVGEDGNVYVVDTGNKRVQVFGADGTFVSQHGGGGVIEGRFDEPVGLAQDGAGNWYVVDTWNQRIQTFDAGFGYVGQWGVNGWGSQNVTNKPYVAVDSERGLVYTTDPEGYRVLVFGVDGEYRAMFGLYGNEAGSFMLPTGIAVGPDGRVYVADGDAHRIMIFPPVE
jgi:uncharacterized protein (TIGR03663 family)